MSNLGVLRRVERDIDHCGPDDPIPPNRVNTSVQVHISVLVLFIKLVFMVVGAGSSSKVLVTVDYGDHGDPYDLSLLLSPLNIRSNRWHLNRT